MIAVSSSGTGFRALATYLVHGRTGLEEGRICWASARNLPTDDPELAATLMRATAAQNVRVEKPVYHLALAFDPGDRVDQATMERVADRVLARLGLEEHQALIVSHRDREHPHLHILVNRVHPETGKVWDRWQEMSAIQQVLREEERALGLREVPGHLHVREGGRNNELASLGEQPVRALGDGQRVVERGPGQELRGPGGAVRAPGERNDGTPMSGVRDPDEGRRAGNSTLVERARTTLPAVRDAGSWEQVDRALGDAGLQLERRGSGLVVTDGERYTKASSVGPDLTLRRLEARLGARRVSEAQRDRPGDAAPLYPGRGMDGTERPNAPDRAGPGTAAGGRNAEETAHDRTPELPGGIRRGRDIAVPAFAPVIEGPVSPVLDRLARDAAQLERIHELAVAQREVAQAHSTERARLAQLDTMVERRERASGALDGALARTYVEPARARSAFETAVRTDGVDTAAARLRDRPESYGELVAEQRSRALGLVRQRDDTAARQSARDAFALAVEWSAAERALGVVMGQGRGADGRPIDAHAVGVDTERRRRLGALEEAGARERMLAAERRGLPAAEVLERGLREAVRRLTPAEVQQLQAMLTRPQVAIVARVRQTVKEAVLGRDVGE